MPKKPPASKIPEPLAPGAPPEDKLEIVCRFVERLDLKLGSLPEGELKATIGAFSEKVQPEVIALLSAIEEENQIDPEFLGECVFHLYAMHRFHEDVLQVKPRKIGQKELLGLIDTVDKLFEDVSATGDAGIENMEIPFLQREIPGIFFIVWRDCLEQLLEEGSIDENVWYDLLRFDLVVLKAYGDQFPDAHM